MNNYAISSALYGKPAPAFVVSVHHLNDYSIYI